MNQNFLVLYLLFLSLQHCTISALIFSGTIMENTTFYYKRFPTFASKSATMEYNVTYMQYPLSNFPVKLYIYTTEDHRDLQTKCISSDYGQLKNEDFWIPLNPRLIPYRQTKCVEKHKQVHCSGKITIRDYIPRIFGFSVGYECVNRNIFSVQGLEFKFMITNQSNITDCIRTNNIFWGICKYNYDYTTLGNLVGVDFDMLKHKLT